MKSNCLHVRAGQSCRLLLTTATINKAAGNEQKRRCLDAFGPSMICWSYKDLPNCFYTSLNVGCVQENTQLKEFNVNEGVICNSHILHHWIVFG